MWLKSAFLSAFTVISHCTAAKSRAVYSSAPLACPRSCWTPNPHWVPSFLFPLKLMGKGPREVGGLGFGSTQRSIVWDTAVPGCSTLDGKEGQFCGNSSSSWIKSFPTDFKASLTFPILPWKSCCREAGMGAWSGRRWIWCHTGKGVWWGRALQAAAPRELFPAAFPWPGWCCRLLGEAAGALLRKTRSWYLKWTNLGCRIAVIGQI